MRAFRMAAVLGAGSAGFGVVSLLLYPGGTFYATMQKLVIFGSVGILLFESDAASHAAR